MALRQKNNPAQTGFTPHLCGTKSNSGIAQSCKSAGFTLLELLFSIGILVILGGAAGVSLYNAYRNSLLDSTSSQIQSVIRTAQQKSLAQENGQSWGAYFNNSSSSPYFALFYGTSYSAGDQSSIYYLPPTIKYTSPSSNSAITIVFAKLTGMPTATATITISNTIKTENLIINSVGEVNNQ